MFISSLSSIGASTEASCVKYRIHSAVYSCIGWPVYCCGTSAERNIALLRVVHALHRSCREFQILRGPSRCVKRSKRDPCPALKDGRAREIHCLFFITESTRSVIAAICHLQTRRRRARQIFSSNHIPSALP